MISLWTLSNVQAEMIVTYGSQIADKAGSRFSTQTVKCLHSQLCMSNVKDAGHEHSLQNSNGKDVKMSNSKCDKCGQQDEGQTGEYHCSKCGLPTLWDEPPANRVEGWLCRNHPSGSQQIAFSETTANQWRESGLEVISLVDSSELSALCSQVAEQQRQLYGLAKQEPVGVISSCSALGIYFETPDGTNIYDRISVGDKLYRHPPNLPALIELAKQEERERLQFVLESSAFIHTRTSDGGTKTYQLWTQDEDEELIVLHDKDAFFATAIEAVDAAIRARTKE